MKESVFIWTCPACGELVSTLLAEADDAALVCGACRRRFDEEPELSETPARTGPPPR